MEKRSRTSWRKARSERNFALWEIKNRYPKPARFPPPTYDDLTDYFADLLAKNEEDYRWSHYADIFGHHLPAGTYEEIVYFLPNVLSYLLEEDEGVLDLLTPIFRFCSEHKMRLKAEGYLPAVEESIWACLEKWTKEFVIEHYDFEQCQAKGWNLMCYDIVQHSELVCVALEELVRFESLKDIAFTFVQSIADFGNDHLKAKWFLELSRERFYTCDLAKIPEINDILADRERLQRAYDLLFDEAMNETMSPSYWRDTFNLLGL